MTYDNDRKFVESLATSEFNTTLRGIKEQREKYSSTPTEFDKRKVQNTLRDFGITVTVIPEFENLTRLLRWQREQIMAKFN